MLIEVGASAWRSFSGHSLVGEGVTRFVYLDEAGIGKPEHDPHVVVAGVIVHADKMIKPLKLGLERIMREHIPANLHRKFYFHAKEYFNGGKVLRRADGWTHEKGMAVGNSLAELLVAHNVPVVWATVPRGSVQIRVQPNIKAVVLEQMVAFMSCLTISDDWMRNKAPDEVCTIVAENNEQAKAMLHSAQIAFRSDALIVNAGNPYPGVFPLQHIEENVLFAEKAESPLLQLADFCAYITKRAAVRDERYLPIAGKISPLCVKRVPSAP